MNILLDFVHSTWEILLDSSFYILVGIVVAGLLKVFLSPAAVARHLARGRIMPVVKSALFGIPLPLCSCGVLPAAAALKKQGANNGATVAFLISTPESGVDSISITYALLDPIMTVARPVAAMVTAMIAGIAENLRKAPEPTLIAPDLSCSVDNCCDGVDCPPETHRSHHTLAEKLKTGFTYAFTELWGDIAPWFVVGVLLAGMISALVPEAFLADYLGGGIRTMLLMLAVGIPLYICATASTPIAAALIMKGVSPGAALVFLLAGPATNLASLTVLSHLIGKRATGLYLASIAVTSVTAGLVVDAVYNSLRLDPRVVMGEAAEVLPFWLKLAAALAVVGLSIGPVWRALLKRFARNKGCSCDGCHPPTSGFPS